MRNELLEQVENMDLMECYYINNSSERAYMQRLWEIEIFQNPTSVQSNKSAIPRNRCYTQPSNSQVSGRGPELDMTLFC